MVDLVCQAAVDLLGYSSWRWQLLVDLWLRNTLANGHSDLIYFERLHRPRAFFFSPFLTRPLGIPLPSILTFCPCKVESQQGDLQGNNRGVRKVWKVSHKGRKDMPLGQVVIKVQCSCCKRSWRIQKPGLKGVLWTSGGLYASIVDYFD
jgi:hypothetical protein